MMYTPRFNNNDSDSEIDVDPETCSQTVIESAARVRGFERTPVKYLDLDNIIRGCSNSNVRRKNVERYLIDTPPISPFSPDLFTEVNQEAVKEENLTDRSCESTSWGSNSSRFGPPINHDELLKQFEEYAVLDENDRDVKLNIQPGRNFESKSLTMSLDEETDQKPPKESSGQSLLSSKRCRGDTDETRFKERAKRFKLSSHSKSSLSMVETETNSGTSSISWRSELDLGDELNPDYSDFVPNRRAPKVSFCVEEDLHILSYIHEFGLHACAKSLHVFKRMAELNYFNSCGRRAPHLRRRYVDCLEPRLSKLISDPVILQEFEDGIRVQAHERKKRMHIVMKPFKKEPQKNWKPNGEIVTSRAWDFNYLRD